MSWIRASLPAALAGVLTIVLLWAGVRWPAWELSGPLGDGSGYSRTRAWFRTTGVQDPSFDAGTGRQFTWTAARARIIVPELSRSRRYRMTLRISAGRAPDTPPPPAITISVDGSAVLTAPTSNDAADYTVDIPAASGTRLIVAIDAANTYATPPPDQRTLGVVIEDIRFQPIDAAFTPTWPTLLAAGAASFLLVLAMALCGWPVRWSLAAAVLTAAVHAWLLRLDGAFLGTAAGDMASIAAGVAAAAAAVAALRRWRPGRGVWAEWPLAAGLALLAIGLKLAIFVHPQMQIGDAVFHVHRAQNVVGGNYFFTSTTPRPYYEFPYAIALYVVALPFWSWFPSDPARVHLLRGLAIIADGLVAVAMFPAVRALAGRWAAVAFAVLYPTVPITAQALGAANLTNVFGQGVFGAAMGVVAMVGSAGAGSVLAVTSAVLLAIAFLSHFSTASVGVPLVGLSGTLAVGLARGSARRAGVLILAALLAAGVVSYATYYSHFHDVYRATYARVRTGTSQGETRSLAAPPSEKVRRFRYELGLNFGWPLLACAAAGVVVLARRRPRDPITLVLAGWLGAWIVFAALGVLTAVEMRANLAAAPLFAALAAIALGAMADHSRRAGRVASALVMALAALGSGALLICLGI